MAKPLVIVESPAKAKTIASFLGNGYTVESSVGHIRDLPSDASDIPASMKGESWARLGVDVDNGFKPLYVVVPGKKERVTRLRALLKDASELYLATDEDREGESIAWHLMEVLNPRVPVKRMVFHEITPEAIQRAVDNWRDLDRRLVDAQETRRILDRLYGYEVSPVLWRKVLPRLSAGRVQSVATRLLVERERARMRFRAASFWDIDGRFRAQEGSTGGFGASLVALDGTRLATGRDFGEDGELSREDVVRLDEAGAFGLVDRLEGADFSVRSVEEKPWKRSPYPPFLTSTLQQEAGRKLRFSAARTMRVAQDLYEAGHITYMRTDSTTLSDQALSAARQVVTERYGNEYLPPRPRRYDKRVKNAQEAHEAIRPAGDTFRHPERSGLHGDQLRLYELIWQRTVASQMSDAQGLSVQVRLGAISSAGEDAEFAANGRVISFPGFLRAYVEGSDDPEAELEDREVRLPRLAVGDRLAVEQLLPEGHTTQPPARYTEASLVKALEEMGVGRPSTYATILDTIQSRGYVWKKGTALVPSWTAFAVVGLLEQHFARLVDYSFTAEMEEDLDEIARGDEEPLPWLTRFYFGSPGAKDDGTGLKQMVAERLAEIDARAVNSIPIGGVESDVVVRVGRFGPYIQEGEKRASLPEDLAPDELTLERARELLDAPPAERSDRVLGDDPETGLPVLVQSRPVRAVRATRAGRGAEHQAEDGLPAVRHDPRRSDPGRGPSPAHFAAQPRPGRSQGRGRCGRQWPLRPLRAPRVRLSLARKRRAAVYRDAGERPRPLVAAESTPGQPGGPTAAGRARPRPGKRCPGRRQRRPLWALRDGRDRKCLATPGRQRRDADYRAGGRAVGRTPPPGGSRRVERRRGERAGPPAYGDGVQESLGDEEGERQKDNR